MPTNSRGSGSACALAVALAVSLSMAACTGPATHTGADGRATGKAHASKAARAPGIASAAVTPASWCAGGKDRPSSGAASATGTGTGRSHHGPLHDDFNGDGYSDVAFPVPRGDLEGLKMVVDGRRSGYVAVIYGSAHGLRTSSKQIFDQDRPGIPGVGERGDSYGSAAATADLDQDGYADLIVGTVAENWHPSHVTMTEPEDYRSQGSLSVIWGGPHGLSGSTTLRSRADADDSVGGNIVVGDFDGDGAWDVVTVTRHGTQHQLTNVDGVPGGKVLIPHDKLRVLSGPFDRTGTPAGGVHDVAGPRNSDILDLATGDVNGDGVGDVVSTSVQKNAGSRVMPSELSYWRGTRDGLSRGTPAGRPFSPQEDGGEVDVGDVNGDGYADIVTDDHFDYVSPDDGGSGVEEAQYAKEHGLPDLKSGMVIYLPGSKAGPDTRKIKTFNQDSPGVPGVAHEDSGGDEEGGTEYFGSSISVGDIDGDGYADLSVGVPGKIFDNTDSVGSVITLRGTAQGPTGKGAQVITEDTKDVPGVAEGGDFFGSATKLVDTDDDGHADLIVGGELGTDDTPHGARGAVWVFRSTVCGVTPKGSFAIGAHTLGTPKQFAAGLGSDFGS